MNRVQWLTAAVLIVTAAGSGLWFGRPAEAPPVLEPAIRSESDLAEYITVHAAGEVRKPGLVEVPAGSRVASVIDAAGGFSSAADQSAINLAAPVVDGQQIVVYARIAAVDGAGGAASVAGDGRVVVNQADADALEAIPGVGEVLAERIVAHRLANGLFGVVEDLLDVPGIGESKLAAMRDYVRIP